MLYKNNYLLSNCYFLLLFLEIFSFPFTTYFYILVISKQAILCGLWSKKSCWKTEHCTFFFVSLFTYNTDITIHLHNKALHTLYWHFPIGIYTRYTFLYFYLCIELIPTFCISPVITYEMVIIRSPDNFLFLLSGALIRTIVYVMTCDTLFLFFCHPRHKLATIEFVWL